MDASFDLEIYPEYLHIKHRPNFVINPASADQVWANIGRLCREHDRNKVLVEAESPVRQLDTMAAFDSGRILAEIAPGATIAICFSDYEFDELSTFFKTVAQNRGVKVEFFNELDKAIKWLDVDTGHNAAQGG
jgi:hypothetical protein